MSLDTHNTFNTHKLLVWQKNETGVEEIKLSFPKRLTDRVHFSQKLTFANGQDAMPDSGIKLSAFGRPQSRRVDTTRNYQLAKCHSAKYHLDKFHYAKYITTNIKPNVIAPNVMCQRITSTQS